MGFLGRLFGSEKAIEGAVNGLRDGLDALVYTGEEKAQDIMKDRAAARGMLIEWVKNTQGQNLARRLLAMGLGGIWAFMFLLSSALDVAAIWWVPPESLADDAVNQVALSAAAIDERADSMTGAMMLILGFYFAAPHMGPIVAVAMERFGGKK